MSNAKKNWALASIIFAGEAIFFLPFVIPRIFKPTYLQVFSIDTLDLGTCFSAFGITALISYFFGGPLADRIAPHKLMSLALGMTGLGGVFLSTIPSLAQLHGLYVYWGLTTILLFWASMLRTVRLLGGQKQGFAFGLLDGGRGLVAAAIGSIMVWLFGIWLGGQVLDVDDNQRADVFSKVILIFSAMVFLAAGLVWVSLRKLNDTEDFNMHKVDWRQFRRVFSIRTVWLQAIIIICAYSAYRIGDDFALLARDILAYDEVKSAQVGSMALWLRPLAAIGAGLLADRLSSSRMTQFCFSLLIVAGGLMSFWPSAVGAFILVFIIIVTTSLGVYALRGLYFSIMNEGKIPIAVTGTAIGIASFIGYMPDIYMTAWTGKILKENPGIAGHQQVYLLLIGFAIVGLIATSFFRLLARSQSVALDE